MQDLIERFKAKGNSGSEYEVLVIQRLVRNSTLDGLDSSLAGLPEAMLADGRRLNKIDDDTFKVVDTGEVVRRL